MKKIDLINEIKLPQYDFLKTDVHLNNNIILLGLGGSRAYGVETSTSDWDWRGVASNSYKEILLGQDFEQVVDKTTDTTIYSIKKFVNLLISNNPNILEICGNKPEHIIYMNEIGQGLIENKSMFLSRKAIGSFKGYALAQLHRLENALCHDTYSEEQQLAHIKNAMDRAIISFNGRYEHFKEGMITIDNNTKDILINCDINDMPLGEYNGIINELKEILKTYNKLNARNNKKDEYHLSKHIMHIFRLLYMYIDIAKDMDIITYREKEQEYLLSIKNGLFLKEDGSLRKEFYDAYSELEKEVDYVTKHTVLPEHPDYAKIEDFLMSSNMATILKQYNTTDKLLKRIIGEHKYE